MVVQILENLHVVGDFLCKLISV